MRLGLELNLVLEGRESQTFLASLPLNFNQTSDKLTFLSRNKLCVAIALQLTSFVLTAFSSFNRIVIVNQKLWFNHAFFRDNA